MDVQPDLPLVPLPQLLLPLTAEDRIRRHVEAFRKHPRAERYRAREPGLGTSVSWVLVSCDCIRGIVEGIIVGGDWDNEAREWFLDGHFSLFDADDGVIGDFTGISGWMFGQDDIEVLGELAGDAP